MRSRENNKKQKIIVYFIAFIMVASIGGFIYGGQTQKVGYEGYKMVGKGNFWVTKINKKEARFNYFPTEVIDIEIDPLIIDKLSNTFEIDVTSSENSTYAESIALAIYEMSQELGMHYSKFVRVGFVENNSYNLPIINCSSATSVIPVINFVESNETKIYQSGDCIIAKSRSSLDVIRIKDRILYGIHNIIR